MFKLVDCQSFGSGVRTSTNIKTRKNCLSVFQWIPFWEKKKAAWRESGGMDRLCRRARDVFWATSGASAAATIRSGAPPGDGWLRSAPWAVSNLLASFSVAKNSLENDKVKNADGEFFPESLGGGGRKSIPFSLQSLNCGTPPASDSCFVVTAEQNYSSEMLFTGFVYFQGLFKPYDRVDANLLFWNDQKGHDIILYLTQDARYETRYREDHR